MEQRRRQTQYIVVHCSATKPDSDIGFDEIDDWHRARGWAGCGYHAIIRRSGLIEFGRHFDVPGAHVQGQNYRSVGICLVGGLNSSGEPDAGSFESVQFASLIELLDMLERAYPEAMVLGHRDLSPDLNGDGVIEEWEWQKDCPCFDVRDWYTRMIAEPLMPATDS